MTSRAVSPRKWILVILMVCAFTTAQFSALALESEHHHSPDHCCALCHVGLPFLQPAVTADVPPVLIVVWLAPSSDADTPHQTLLAQASSRAPPA